MKESKISISSFLKVRVGTYKPNDSRITKYKRLEKIDFSGEIHLSDKPSKTNMIIVEPGDLVISGINVAKGAISIYQGTENISATIHYSSYTFDSSKVNIDYFKKFLKSPLFIQELEKQVKGGIKTEIKPKHLLPIQINLPSMEEQLKINEYFNLIDNKLFNIDNEVQLQSTYLSKLRQSILQEAIEGKLTEDWREKNRKSITKGDPNTDAVALLEKIKSEKEKMIAEGKLRKDKPLPAIKKEEIPFVLPEGWVWCRLGEVITEPPKNGYSPKESNKETNVKSLKLGATTWGVFDRNKFKFIDEEIPINSTYWLKFNDILIQRSNSLEYVGVSAIYTGKDFEFIYPDLMMKIRPYYLEMVKYLHKTLSSPFNRDYFRKSAKGSQKTMPKINQEIVLNTILPLPPLAEQHAIVEKIESLMKSVEELETQVQERKRYAEDLLQSVLREAFEG